MIGPVLGKVWSSIIKLVGGDGVVKTFDILLVAWVLPLIFLFIYNLIHGAVLQSSRGYDAGKN